MSLISPFQLGLYDRLDQRYPSAVPLLSETHGGADVGIFAMGPWAHLVSSTHENTHIAHVMAYAARLGPYANGGCTHINY